MLLARRIRPLGPGYVAPARELLEAAIGDAEAAAALDPTWMRGPERHAEALLALGPNERAMDAYRVLRQAVQEAESRGAPVPPELPPLMDRAKAQARPWCAVQGKLSPEQALRRALREAERVVVGGLATDSQPDAVAASFGRKLTEAVATVAAVLRAGYANPRWDLEGSEVYNDVQLTLRQLAKCVPLKAVQASDDLRQLVFVDAPWSLWGLDRLDTVGVEALPFDAADPVPDEDKADAVMNEGLARATGAPGDMDMGRMMGMFDMFSGKRPDSRRRDMTPHHLCSFSLTVLQNLVLANYGGLADAAVDRIIALATCQSGGWAGGEFLGHALTTAAGIPKYGIKSNPTQCRSFLRRPMATVALANEICLSGDDRTFLQPVLASITPSEWAQKSPTEVSSVLFNYVLSCMDCKYLALDPKVGANKGRDRASYEDHIPGILGAMLDGYPVIRELLEGAFDDEEGEADLDGPRLADAGRALAAFAPLLDDSSPFAMFVLRRFAQQQRKELGKGPDRPGVRTEDVLRKLVRRWGKTSNAERAGYRYETFSDEMRGRLAEAGMAPVDNVQATIRWKTEQASSTLTLATQTPECAHCGAVEGPRLQLRHCQRCKAEKYCGPECQKAEWPRHKAQCRLIQGLHGGGGAGGVHPGVGSDTQSLPDAVGVEVLQRVEDARRLVSSVDSTRGDTRSLDARRIEDIHSPSFATRAVHSRSDMCSSRTR